MTIFQFRRLPKNLPQCPLKNLAIPYHARIVTRRCGDLVHFLKQKTPPVQRKDLSRCETTSWCLPNLVVKIPPSIPTPASLNTKEPSMLQIRIGIAGWALPTPWRGTFYPEDLTQKRELE